MSQQNRQPDLIEHVNTSRRSVAIGLLGAFGGASALLSGCGLAKEGEQQSVEPSSEGVEAAQQALTGIAGLRWFDKMEGTAADPGLVNTTGSANEVVLLLGYYAPGDGGGGLFVWSKSPRLDNRGTAVNPGAAATTAAPGWRRLYSGAINIRWFGAKGDGTTDDSKAVQAALDEVNGAGGGAVFVPSGTYVVEGIKLYSYVTLSGEGSASILKQKSGARFCIGVNPFGAGTADVVDNKRGITLRDLCFLGTVATDSFSQHYHLIILSAASDVLIERCWIIGFRGDGIYIGSGDVGAVERHNENITIRSCSFDGVNNDNRQGISIIDGSGILIEDNDFTRCTRPGMPGAIDIEPNAFDYARVRDIKILNNRFTKVGGGVGVISLVLPKGQAELKTPMSGLTIAGNHISDSTNSGGITLLQQQSPDAMTQPNGVLIENNDVSGCGRGMLIHGVKGIKILNNRISATLGPPVSVGWASRQAYDLAFENNYLYQCDTTSGGGMRIIWATQVRIARNTFDSLGSPSGSFGYAIDFSHTGGSGGTGGTSYITIEDNLVVPGGRTRVAIQVEGGHNLSPETNRFRGNNLGGLGSAFLFQAPDSVLDAKASIAAGTIASGTTFVSSAISVLGADIGDGVQISAGDLGGLQLSGYVSAKNTVKFTLSNNTGSSVTLPLLTYYLKVTKR